MLNGGDCFAAVIGYCVLTLFGFIYFSVKKSGTLSFAKPLCYSFI